MPSVQLFPLNWYWLADDGRVYSAAAQNIVAAQDTGYAAFLAAGNLPTKWPRDAQGAQSNAALTDVIASYGLALTPAAALIAYAAAKRYAKETGGATVDGVAMPTDRTTQAQLTGAYLAAQQNAQLSIQWKLADGSFVALNATQIGAIAVAVSNFVQGCFATEATVVAGINAGTIVGKEQIDAAFA